MRLVSSFCTVFLVPVGSYVQQKLIMGEIRRALKQYKNFWSSFSRLQKRNRLEQPSPNKIYVDF